MTTDGRTLQIETDRLRDALSDAGAAGDHDEATLLRLALTGRARGRAALRYAESDPVAAVRICAHELPAGVTDERAVEASRGLTLSHDDLEEWSGLLADIVAEDPSLVEVVVPESVQATLRAAALAGLDRQEA